MIIRNLTGIIDRYTNLMKNRTGLRSLSTSLLQLIHSFQKKTVYVSSYGFITCTYVQLSEIQLKRSRIQISMLYFEFNEKNDQVRYCFLEIIR